MSTNRVDMALQRKPYAFIAAMPSAKESHQSTRSLRVFAFLMLLTRASLNDTREHVPFVIQAQPGVLKRREDVSKNNFLRRIG